MEISFPKAKAVDVSEIFSLKTPEGGVFLPRTIEIVAVEGESYLSCLVMMATHFL